MELDGWKGGDELLKESKIISIFIEMNTPIIIIPGGAQPQKCQIYLHCLESPRGTLTNH